MRKGTFSFPYAQLSLRPSSADRVVEIGVDKEAGGEAFTYRLSSGKSDTVLLEQVLAYNKDPEQLREELLCRLTIAAQEALSRRRLSKRHFARQLKTSPAHLYRLLDQTFYGKTIDQMVILLQSLGEEVELKVKRAA